jgi:hypothetical protein
VASNQGSASYVVKIDKTAPTANPAQTSTANAAGWNTSDVTVTWNWTDGQGSGIDPVSCTTRSTSTGSGVQELTATCSDLAGNSGTASQTVRVDKTPPTIVGAATALPNANGWYKGPCTVHFTCSDPLLVWWDAD